MSLTPSLAQFCVLVKSMLKTNNSTCYSFKNARGKKKNLIAVICKRSVTKSRGHPNPPPKKACSPMMDNSSRLLQTNQIFSFEPWLSDTSP